MQGEVEEDFAVALLRLMDSIHWYFEDVVDRVLEVTPLSFFIKCLKGSEHTRKQTIRTLS